MMSWKYLFPSAHKEVQNDIILVMIVYKKN